MKRILTFLLAGWAAQATIVPSISLEELIDQSEVIAHGRVTRSWCDWDTAHKYIWTHHQIEVLDWMRGSGAASVIASEPGGELNGLGMKFSGVLEYALGEETIVFLYRTPIGYLRATGHGQGKYTITPQRHVRANLKGVDLTGRSSALATLDGLKLTDFKTRVRAAIRSRR